MLACQPRPSNRLVVALGADPASLHPLLQTGLLEASVYANIYDPLIALDADGRLRPALAESWEAWDERTWAFRLREGVAFHNDERFDAESVRFTVQQMLDPATGSPIRAQLDAIQRVETPDPRTAVIVTKQPFAPLLSELTGLMMLPPVHAARVGVDGLANRPVGTGSFGFVERIWYDRIVLEANRRHWRGAPPVDRLEFQAIRDPLVRWAALRTGDVDLATGVPADQVATLERDGLQVLSRAGIQTLYVRLDARKPPLDDRRVRRAIAHAVDVDQLIQTIYGGRAHRVNGPYPPQVFAYDADAPSQRYDPGMARALLREAGVGEGAVLTFETPRGRYPQDEPLVLAISDYLAQAGLRTRIQALEWAAYLERVTSGKAEHLFLLAGTNRTFDPHFTIARIYANASAMGHAYYGNPDVDALAATAAATLDPEQRRGQYRRVLETLRSDVVALWIAQPDDLYAAQPRVRWDPAPTACCGSGPSVWAVYDRKRAGAPRGIDMLSDTAVAEMHIVWLTAGLGCDGDTIAMTAATQPSIEDLLSGGGVKIRLPKTANLPEAELEWKIPRWANTLERDRARSYFPAYAAAAALHFAEKGLQEVYAGRTATWSDFTVPEQAIGCGFHEAVRGALSHHVVIREGKIANYHPYPPTAWNASPRDSFGTPGPYEDAIQDTPLFEENGPDAFKGIDIMRTVRRFDPCMPCGVHMYLGDGRVLDVRHSPTFGTDVRG